MPTSYQPIACALHDEFEIAIMRKETISISWLDEKDVNQQETVIASDIVVKNKQEFLVFKIHVANTPEVTAHEITALASNRHVGKTVNRTQYCIRLDRVTLLTR